MSGRVSAVRRLLVTAHGLLEQQSSPDFNGLAIAERLGLLDDREILARRSHRSERMLFPPAVSGRLGNLGLPGLALS